MYSRILICISLFLQCKTYGMKIVSPQIMEKIAVKETIFTCGDDMDNLPNAERYCYIMLKSGNNVNSGEKYWKIVVNKLSWLSEIGLTNESNFEKGTKMYLDEFHPFSYSPSNTIGILTSLSSGKLKAFFSYNNKPFEQVFELETNSIEDFYPAFKLRPSDSITITEETSVPLKSARKCTKNLPTFSDIGGHWTASSPKSIKVDGKQFTGSKNSKGEFLQAQDHAIALEILQTKTTENQYVVILDILNDHIFRTQQCDEYWRSTSPASTRMGGSPEHMSLENTVIDLVAHPDSVTVEGNKLTFVKDDMAITFVR